MAPGTQGLNVVVVVVDGHPSPPTVLRNMGVLIIADLKSPRISGT